MRACVKAKKFPPPGWTELKQPYRPVLDRSMAGTGIGATHKIGLPLHVYPLYENAFRAYRNQSVEENHRESARLYADFAKVAERNSMSWMYGEKAETEESIGTVTGRNRMICYPCECY